MPVFPRFLFSLNSKASSAFIQQITIKKRPFRHLKGENMNKKSYCIVYEENKEKKT